MNSIEPQNSGASSTGKPLARVLHHVVDVRADELRQVFDPDDYAARFTAELQQKEERLWGGI